MQTQNSLKGLAGAVLGRTMPCTLPAQSKETTRTLSAQYQTSTTHCNTPKTHDLESVQIKLIRAWLTEIDEPEADHHLVLSKCKCDPEALAYFLELATKQFIEKHREKTS